ncbi:MAG: helix-turn-helix domain-containing protein [Lachnospiraceae bacterium]|nr:helix-turn-helix domain-containing protein [Lachnospiraceae bacterium]
MIKVLLADDNKMSLQYFSELICWEDYGYTLVSTSVDGENAWYDFQKFMPHVVITDIQMPLISGIDLAKKILNLAPNTIILFLSSYSEFRYARKAVQLRIYDYLLKHETTKEALIQKLEDIKIYLNQEKTKQHLLAKEEISYLFLRPNDQNPEKNGIASFLPEKYDCFFLDQQHNFPFLTKRMGEYFEDEDILSEEMTIENCCRNFTNFVALVPVSAYQFLLVTTPNENPFDFCCKLQRVLKDATSCGFYIVIIQKKQHIQKSAAYFEEIKTYLPQIYFYPPSTIIEGTYLTPYPPLTYQPDYMKQYTPIKSDMLANMDQLFHKMVEKKDYLYFCFTADAWLEILLSYDQRIVHPVSGQIVSLFTKQEIQHGCDVNEIYLWIRKKFSNLIEILSLYKFSEFSPLIQEAVFLISKNYGNYDLNVDWIAEKLKISPSNLNIQFKRETGFTPWRVIVNTRLSRACSLLENGKDTLSQICFKTGYNSLSYFSKSFKKAYGISPQEYRRRIIHEADKT